MPSNIARYLSLAVLCLALTIPFAVVNHTYPIPTFYAEFSALGPPPLPVSPSWSPVAEFGGYSRYQPATILQQACADGCANLCGIHAHGHMWAWRKQVPVSDANGFWGALGCSCFAF